MAKLTSPGVTTRETDNSQYVETTGGVGNIACLVGYAEKGPFEPTLVNGYNDFKEKFGSTLLEAPYLAMGARKYFNNSDNLLVVRAGNDRDPIAEPTASKQSEINLRLNPKKQEATKGYQTFSAEKDLEPGIFSAGSSYGFKVLSDFNAYKKERNIQQWKESTDTLKISFDADIPSNYRTANINIGGYFKDNLGNIYRADGDSGSIKNGKIDILLKKYTFNTFSESDTMQFSGDYVNVVKGTKDISAGFDFSTTNKKFTITLDNKDYEVTMNVATTSVDTIVTHLTSLFDGIILKDANDINIQDADGNDVKLSSRISVEKFDTNKIILKTSYYDSITLKDDTTGGLVEIGLAAGTYKIGFFGNITGSVVKVFDYKLDKNYKSVSFEDYMSVSLTAPSTGSWTIQKISEDIETAFPTGYTGKALKDTDGKLRIEANNVATETFDSIVNIMHPDSGNSLVSILGGTDKAVKGIISNANVGEVVYTIKAKEKGSYGQKIIFRVETEVVSLPSETITNYNVYILLDGKEVSAYQSVVFDKVDDINFFITRMKDNPYVSVEYLDEDEDKVFAIKIPDGDWKLGVSTLPKGVKSDDAEIFDVVVGSNGWIQSGDAITSGDDDMVKAIDKVYNDEVYEFNLVSAPGFSSKSVNSAIQNLCNSRKDCFGILDACPLGIGLGIKNKTNSIRDVEKYIDNITSSYVAAYFPWIQDRDSDNSVNVWLPPSIYAFNACAFTDSNFNPWLPPAGLRRGLVNASGIEYSLSKIERDILYGGTNIVNPIVFFVNEGMSIWGQKTGQRTKSATDRVNVRRLIIYVKKLISDMSRNFLFEPTDEIQWSLFTRQANSILEPIRQGRGLTSYSVLCNSDTNTKELQDQNIMAGIIILQPTKVAEEITLGFTINSQGDASFSV